MRVISGSARGTKLLSQEGLNTRPTLDRVKEALFSIIQFEIEGANVLDLFAGSGALGIETLSRGANSVVFCDNNQESVRIITKNIENTKMKEKSIVIKADYKKALSNLKSDQNKFDIVFLDPPYKTDFALRAVEYIMEYDLLNQKGIIILETNDEKMHNKILSIDGIEIFDERKYGKVILIFIRKE